MDDKELKISLEYLKSITSFSSRCLTGKILKRFELIEDREALKKIVKELIYENNRDLIYFITEHSEGRNLHDVKFVNRPTK